MLSFIGWTLFLLVLWVLLGFVNLVRRAFGSKRESTYDKFITFPILLFMALSKGKRKL